MIIDLEKDLTSALGSPTVVAILEELVGRVLRRELALAGIGDELLDVKRAAEFLGISPAAVSKGCQRGSLPCMKVGNRLRIRRIKLLMTNPVITGLKL